MALTLKEIQAKLLEQQAYKDRFKNGGPGGGGDNSIYPFWNNPDGSTSTMRFLADGDESNDFFWRERLIIKLPFRGVKGANETKPCEVQVPSMDMWKPGSDPIAAEIRPWWKDKSLEDMARKYWRKKSYVFQGFVPQNPNKDDVEPENPIRRFIINPSVFDVIKSILMDQDLENSPIDIDSGRDFYLIKTTKGGFANYASSKWAMKERPLTQLERDAVDKHGLFNLNSFLPKKPDEEHLAAVMEMFAASVDGDLYDADRWGQFYRPTGMRFNDAATDSDSGTTTVARQAAPQSSAASIMSKMAPKVSAPEAVTEEVDPPFDVEPVAPAKKTQSPEDILAAIRKRQQSK